MGLFPEGSHLQRAFVVLVALALLFSLARLIRTSLGAAKVRRDARAVYFDRAIAGLTAVRRRIEPTGFPRIACLRNGISYDLQVVPDTLTFRKLPALWVLVTQTEPLPLKATLDLMMRPTLLEPFSQFRDLPHEIAVPPGLPADCALRCDDPTHLVAEGLLARHASIFADPCVKELILSPRGLRLVFLAEEAERTRYLLFRDAEMGGQPLALRRLEPMLAALERLRKDVLNLKVAG